MQHLTDNVGDDENNVGTPKFKIIKLYKFSKQVYCSDQVNFTAQTSQLIDALNSFESSFELFTARTD